MNKVYKIVWNESLGTWCAISEVSKTRGKRSSAKTTVAGALLAISALTMSSMAAAADHYVSINDGGTQGGNYNNDGATGLNAIAVGVGAKAAGENAIAIGNVSADAINSIAIGNNNSLSNTASSSTAIGHNNNVTGNEALALGANNTVKDFSGVAVGSYNNAEGYRSIAVGAENKTKGQWSSAFGVWNIAEGERATVLGANNTIQGRRALGMGVANEISSASEYSSAVGAFNKITDSMKSLTAGFGNTVIGGEKNSVLGNENTLNNAKNTTVLGNKNTVAQENTQVLGNNVTTTQANSVVLGNASTDRAATAVDKVSINGEDYAFAGVGSATNGVLSVGKVGGERQIINVAAGEVSASSTDAVNGSQLYATHKAIADSQTHYVSINDSGTQGGNYNNDGATGKNALAVGVGAKAVGENDIAIGLKAGTNNDGGWNTSVGSNSGQNINGQKNTALGVGAGHDVRGNNNTVLGVDAGITVTGDSNLAVGDFAGAKVRGSGNTALGKMSGFIVTGTANTATGQESGRNVEGHNNSAFGVKSGNNVQGDSNLALGDSAGENVTGNRNVALGRAAGQGLNNVDDATSLGSGAKAAVRNSVALGANSEAIRDVNSEVAYVPLGTTIVAAKAAGGEVSVGAVGKERRISNVAAASQDTDAVNLSQLKAVQAATTTHYFSINDGGTQGGNYNNDGAVASGSVAIGVYSSSFGTSGVAIGHNADVSGLQGIAIGNNAQAGYQSIALGFDTVATAFNSMALGNRAIAYTDGTTLGQGTYANKLATAMGNGALAVGQESSAYGYSALAGTDSFNQPSAGTDPDTIGKAYATAMGSRAKASAQGSTAVGAGSVAEVDNGIALGANSVANTGAGVAGYVPISANQPQKDAINATQSTLGAVSVGSVGNTRQITNVAAGTIDSDAVNVAQLKAVQAATTTHYFSVNDEGIQGNNYNNDGATGKNALAVGIGAKAVGENDIAIGSGAQAMGGRAVVIGLNAGSGNISDGDANVLIGMNAGTNNDGRWNTSVGSNSGDNTKGQRNTALGDYAGRDVTGNGNIGLGASAGVKVTGETNLAAGASAGGNVEGSYNTALGRTSGVDVIGNSNTATGLDSGSMVRGSSNSAYGQMSGRSVTGDSNVAIGVSSGNNISGNYNAALAYGAGNNSVGNLNTALGFTSGIEVKGDSNSAVGDSAGQRVIGNQNTTQGRVAGQDIFGHQNTAVGAGAGSNVGTNINPSNYNSALGINAGRNVQGNSNLALGDTAGNNVTGSRNVALGRAAGQGLSNVDDATSLGSGAKAAVSNSVALGANSEAIRDVNSEVAYVPLGTTIVAANAAGGEVSVGTVGKERRISNVAAASLDTDAVNLSQLKAVQAATTTHYFSVNDEGIQGNNYNNDGATGKNALAAGRALAGGESSVAIGEGASAKADFSTAVGFLNTVTGQTSVAVGGGNIVAGKNSTAVGASNNVTQENTQVLGNNVTTTQANSVVLGNESTDHAASVVDKVTINGEDYAFAGVGSAANGVVSVGKVDGERQIINVAAGEISATSTDAVNGSQLYATNKAIEDNRIHYFSINGGPTSLNNSNYYNNGATGTDSMAIGIMASASGDGGVAIGSLVDAHGLLSVALGNSSSASGIKAVAVGTYNIAHSDSSVAMGSENNAYGKESIALGYLNFADQDHTVAIGRYNFASSIGSVAVGNENVISYNANESSVLGSFNKVQNSIQALAIGGKNTITDSDNSHAIGGSNTLNNAKNSTLIGNENTSSQDNTFVLGNKVTTSQANSVVLGNESTDRAATAVDKVTINGEDYVFAGVGSTANGVVSVGKVGGERQIINVAAGEISASSTDAINGSQLHATNQAVEKLYAGAGDTTHYVSVNDAGTKANNYNNDGASGALAVAVGIGASAKGDGATALGLNSSAKSKDAVAIGTDTRAELEGSVALGKGSVANTAAGIAGFDPLTGFGFTNTGSTWRSSAAAFSVGDVSRGITRQITGVAAGTADTDAVNVAQLKAAISKTNEAKGSTETVSAGKNTEVTKTTKADGSTDYQVATKDDVSFESVTVGNIKADSQSNTISGLADGKVSADSDQAVNGSQLHDTAESVANALGGNAKVNPDGTIKTSNIGNTGKDNVHDAIASIHGQVAGAKTSVSAGKNTVVNSSTNTDGSNNYQVALAEDIQLNSVTANQVTAKQVTANKVNVGKVTIDGTTNKVSGLANGEITSTSTDAINGSQLHQTNSSVAQHLGGGSTLNKDGSIGAPTYNVAGGTFHNVGDALGARDTRVSNLEQAFYDTNKNMDDLRNDTYAGIAGAMAVGNLPQPTEAGMSMVSAGVSGYRGETAVAIGVSAITDSNKIVWKMGASADSRSNIGGAVSMGYQWK